MKRTAIVASAVLLATGTAAMATASDADGNEDAQEEKRICKTEKITGSLTRVRRTCLTQREWDRLAENTRRSLNDLEQDANRAQAGANNSFQGTGN